MVQDNNPYKVFHSRSVDIRKNVHLLLVRPEEPGNVGSIARVMANMGIQTPLRIVGDRCILSEQAQRLAKHARRHLDEALFFEDYETALTQSLEGPALRLATTAEVGSADRPHPIWAREAMQRAVGKLESQEIAQLVLVFGPEGDGLTNEEAKRCDWIVTIPSTTEYRSLNLAQATLVFCYELNMALLQAPAAFEPAKPSQKQRLVAHMLKIAEEVGFILPGDPHKMSGRLEGIFSRIPAYLPEAKTLHGLLDQISRSVKKGAPDFKGRYRNEMKEVTDGRAQ